MIFRKSEVISRLPRILFLSIGLFFLLTININAYIDPSVMTYAIQAISGIIIALGTVSGMFFRRISKKLNIDDGKVYIENDDLVLGKKDYSFDYNDEFQKAKINKDNSISTKRRMVFALATSLLCAFTYGFFFPSMMFLGNRSEIKLFYSSVWPIFVLVTAVTFLICFTIIMIFYKSKIMFIAGSIIFGIGISLFAQGAFLNPQFLMFNGIEIDWSNYTKATVISNFFWLLILALSIIAIIKKKSVTILFQVLISILIIIVECISIAILPFTQETYIERAVVTKKDEFTISKNKNTIVFIADTLDSEWFENYIMYNPRFSNTLNDFTYFSEVVSGGAPTILGIPAMFTGTTMNPQYEYRNEYGARAYKESTLFEDIYSEGWKLKMYTSLLLLDESETEMFDNVIIDNNIERRITEMGGFLKEMYKLSSFTAFPMSFKRYFYSGENTIDDYIEIANQEYEEYSLEDTAQFYKDYINSGLSLTEEKHCFVVYHLFGSHGPYNMDENAQEIETIHDITIGLSKQTEGNFFIIQEYLNELKRIDYETYDNSTIVITADHGGTGLYQNAAVLVKLPNTTQKGLEVSDKYLTFENLYNTYAKSVLNDANEYGDSLFEAESIEEPRKHVADKTLGQKTFPDYDWQKLIEISDYWAYWIIGTGRDLNNVTMEQVRE